MIARFVIIHFCNLMGMSGGVERESECEVTGRAELELGLASRMISRARLARIIKELMITFI